MYYTIYSTTKCRFPRRPRTFHGRQSDRYIYIYSNSHLTASVAATRIAVRTYGIVVEFQNVLITTIMKYFLIYYCNWRITI